MSVQYSQFVLVKAHIAMILFFQHLIKLSYLYNKWRKKNTNQTKQIKAKHAYTHTQKNPTHNKTKPTKLKTTCEGNNKTLFVL